MGTKKPIVQCIVEINYYKKFKALCKKEERSESKLAGIIIRKYIDEYEKINGEIPLEGE